MTKRINNKAEKPTVGVTFLRSALIAAAAAAGFFLLVKAWSSVRQRDSAKAEVRSSSSETETTIWGLEPYSDAAFAPFASAEIPRYGVSIRNIDKGRFDSLAAAKNRPAGAGVPPSSNPQRFDAPEGRFSLRGEADEHGCFRYALLVRTADGNYEDIERYTSAGEAIPFPCRIEQACWGSDDKLYYLGHDSAGVAAYHELRV